jgi:chromosome segregation ATPase
LKERDLTTVRQTIQDLDSQLKKYKMGLEFAVAELATVRAQLRELAEELSSIKKSSRTAAILSAISADRPTPWLAMLYDQP